MLLKGVKPVFFQLIDFRNQLLLAGGCKTQHLLSRLIQHNDLVFQDNPSADGDCPYGILLDVQVISLDVIHLYHGHLIGDSPDGPSAFGNVKQHRLHQGIAFGSRLFHQNIGLSGRQSLQQMRPAIAGPLLKEILLLISISSVLSHPGLVNRQKGSFHKGPVCSGVI